jgi:ribokinase
MSTPPTPSTTSSTRLCVLGSINMDLVIRAASLPKPGETLLGTSFTTTPGGKGANQAVAAARAGAAVSMIACVGDDAYGQAMKEILVAEGIDASHVQSRAGIPTGIAVITVADKAGENTIVVASGANATFLMADAAIARDAITSADVLLMQLETPMDVVIEAARIAKDAGVCVILNAAPGRKLPWDLLAVIDALIVNRAEAVTILAAATMGADEDELRQQTVEQQMEGLERLGPACIVMTLGAEGAIVSHRRVHKRIAPFGIDAVDTVSAGDAFAGYFAARWAEHQVGGGIDEESVADAVTWGCAAGAIAATRRGAITSLPPRADVIKMLCGR